MSGSLWKQTTVISCQ